MISKIIPGQKCSYCSRPLLKTVNHPKSCVNKTFTSLIGFCSSCKKYYEIRYYYVTEAVIKLEVK